MLYENMSPNNFSPDTKMFYLQQPAMESMEKNQDKTLYKIVKDDGVNKPRHIFSHVKDNTELSYLIKYQPNSYYEILLEGQPQYLYADLDGNFECDSSLERKIISAFISVLEKSFEKYLNEEFNIYNCKWTKNHRGDKFSVHFSYKGKTFTSCDVQKTFWKAVEEEIENDKKIKNILSCIHDGSTIYTKSIIDMSVYTKNRAMRTINSHKREGEPPLLPYTWIGLDTGYFERVNDYTITDYLIHQPESKSYYHLKYKKTQTKTLKSTKFNIEEIKNKLDSEYPDLTIVKPNQHGFYLTRKTGIKEFNCICGESHKSNNASLQIRDSGEIYFKCLKNGDTKLFIGKEVRNQNEEYFWLDYRKLSKIQDITEEELIKYCNDAFQFLSLGATPIFRARYKNAEGEIDYKLIADKNITIFSNFDLNFTIGKNDTNNLMKIIWYLINNNKIPTYADTVFKPYNKVLPKISSDFINTFKEFKYLNYTPTRIIDFEDTKLYKHFKNIVCNNDEKTFKYLKQYLGDKIQNPHITADERGVVLIATGQEGAGKDIFFKAFSKSLGEEHCTTTELGKELFDNFNGRFENKLIVTISETDERSEFRKNAEQFKGIITAKKLTYNSKGEKKRTVDHRTSYIITTNNRNAMSVGRRSFEFEVNNEKAGDWEYFNELGKEVDNEDIMKSMFDYFNQVDIRDYRCQKYPETDTLIQSRQEQAPNFIKFLIDYLPNQDKQIIKVNLNEFRNQHDNFCRLNGLRPCNSTVFGREMSKLGCEKKRGSKDPESGTRPWLLELDIPKIKGQIKVNFKIDVDEC